MAWLLALVVFAAAALLAAAVGTWGAKRFGTQLDFRVPQDEEPNYYAADEAGRAFLEEYHQDYRRLL